MVTKNYINFEIEFIFQQGRSWPELVFDLPVEYKEYQIDDYTKKVNYTFKTDQTTWSFKNINKNSNETIVDEKNQIVQDQSVKISKIWTDNIMLDLDAVLSQTVFIPEYHQGYLDYCKESSIVPATEIQTYNLFFNGLWRLTYTIPFWNWFYLVRKNHRNTKFSKDHVELYIGSEREMYTDLLKKLKELL